MGLFSKMRSLTGTVPQELLENAVKDFVHLMEPVAVH